jgi:hypothetical protein
MRLRTRSAPVWSALSIEARPVAMTSAQGSGGELRVLTWSAFACAVPTHHSVSLRRPHCAVGIWHNSQRRQITVARCEYPARVANEGARRAAANSTSRCLAARSALDWPRSPNCRAPVLFLAPNIPSSLMMLGLNSDALDNSWLDVPPAPQDGTFRRPQCAHAK